MLRPLVALLFSSVMAAPLAAQTLPQKSAEEIRASFEAHRGEFDYLLGDWAFTADNKEWGKAHGYWSAVRLADGQILDEYRIVDDKDQTVYMTTTLRAWNAVLDRWDLVGTDAGRGLQDVGTARRVGNEVHLEQRFGVMSPHPSIWRIRYYAIEADRFSWTADRSTDEGKTWVRAFHTIEAKRIGPARSLPAIAKTPGGEVGNWLSAFGFRLVPLSPRATKGQ